MEGEVSSNINYVQLKDDYSDRLEKMDYYTTHEDEALMIIKNAQNWVARFLDEKLEKIISLKVLDAYFKSTKQI